MEIFQGQNFLEFSASFKTDLDCSEYLATIKWSEGYSCRKCGHDKAQIRKNLSRTCNQYKHIEMIPFFIVFVLVFSKPFIFVLKWLIGSLDLVGIFF